MNYLTWTAIVVGLCLTLWATFLIDPTNVLQLELQLWGILICGVGIVAFFIKAYRAK
jgi:hypothetical protein